MYYDGKENRFYLSLMDFTNEIFARGSIDRRVGFFVPPLRLEPELTEEQKEYLLSFGVGSCAQPLSLSLTYKDIHFTLSASCHCIHPDAKIIDYLLPVRYKRLPKKIPDNLGFYAAMLCYFWAVEAGQNEVFLRFVCQQDQSCRMVQYSKSELEEKFQLLFPYLSWWGEFEKSRFEQDLPTLRDLEFPYPSLRKGQDEMIETVATTIENAEILYAQVPTGTGKTISTLYPAVQAVGKDIIDKVFYFTAKSTHAKEAFSALTKMFAKGGRFRVLKMSSREDMCMKDRATISPLGISSCCNPVDCPGANTFYDRCTEAVIALLSAYHGFTSELVAQTAKQYQLCPYELQLQLARFCDVIICDDNYLFDPAVRLNGFFGEDAGEKGKRYAFLLDEAHNLPNRLRGMYSVSLSSNLFGAYPQHFQNLLTLFETIKNECTDSLWEEHGMEAGRGVLSELPDDFETEIAQSLRLTKSLLTENGTPDAALVEIHHLLKKTNEILSQVGETYRYYGMYRGNEITLNILCMDVSDRCLELFDKSLATVLFSGTLTPVSYFQTLMGKNERTTSFVLHSPFPKQNLLALAYTGLDTRYEYRELSVKRIVNLIAHTVSVKKGNYIVYFPSYAYLQQAYKAFVEKYPKIPTILQSRSMSQNDKKNFLNAFVDDGQLRIGFCVLGGAFAEGVDLPGGRLIGVIVIGIGMPGLSAEKDLLAGYFDEQNVTGMSDNPISGTDMAYIYPGIHSVVQAVGRVIRTETDKGIAVLADRRYADMKIQRLLPRAWKPLPVAEDMMDMSDALQIFWDKNDEES